MSRTAIIAGQGRVPAAVAAVLDAPFICALEGFVPDGITPDLSFRIERLVPLFNALVEAGVTTVTFAGAAQRPRLDPAMFDPATAQLVPGPGFQSGTLTEQDRADATRAAQIVAALGAVDVGQGCVVQQGLCLGVEALPGTDAMLASIAPMAALRPDPARGLFLWARE